MAKSRIDRSPPSRPVSARSSLLPACSRLAIAELGTLHLHPFPVHLFQTFSSSIRLSAPKTLETARHQLYLYDLGVVTDGCSAKWQRHRSRVGVYKIETAFLPTPCPSPSVMAIS